MQIDFDITTPDSAYDFILNVLGMTGEEFITEYKLHCKGDFELLWQRNHKKLDSLDLSNVRFIAFHVTGSLDDCQQIKQIGIHNLQYMLSNNTKLSNSLKEYGVSFDIENYKLYVDDIEYNTNYDYYLNLRNKTSEEEHLSSVAHRIYYDYCVNGFWLNDDIRRYETEIEKRPEFIATLARFYYPLSKLDYLWKNNSTPYKIRFYAHLEQIHKFTFGLRKSNDEYHDFEKDEIKKWMLSFAVDRSEGYFSEEFIYIRDNCYIPPEQILSYEIID